MAFESLKKKMATRGEQAPAAEPAAPAPEPTPAKSPAANPMARIRAAQAAAAAKPADDVVVVEDEPTPAPEKAAKPARAVAAPAVGGGLSLFGGDSAAASSALMAWVDRDENRQAAFSGPEFPTVQLTSGASGGTLDALQGTPGEIVDLLPAGRKAFQAIFIGYRLQVLLWPGEYDPNEKTQPAFSAYIGPDAAEDQAILQAAAVKYMFTKKVDKGKFDDMGHPRPGAEFLVYLPTLDHIGVLRTLFHQESLSQSLRSIAKCLPDGKLQPVPVLVTPTTVERKSKDQTWKMHHYEFSLAVDANAKAMFTKFQAFAAGAKEDAEFMSLFSGWAKTTMTEEIRERLKAASAA